MSESFKTYDITFKGVNGNTPEGSSNGLPYGTKSLVA